MEDAIETHSVTALKILFEDHKAQGLENEEFRHNIERLLHKKAMSYGQSSIPSETIDAFLKFAVSLAKEDLTGKALTVQLMMDVFEVTEIKRCEQLFSIIEDNISTWKTTEFFLPCKNLILRMCNDLLKRLSRTVDTNFCGRILILLAKSLPLTEKSGLNLISQFNTANTTTYEKEEKREVPDVKTEGEEGTDMEVGEIPEKDDKEKEKDTSIPVDYSQYQKFWQLQEYFSNPTLCYDKAPVWRRFESNLTEILSIFSTYKLDRQNYNRDRNHREPSVLSTAGTSHGNQENGPVEEKVNGVKHDMEWEQNLTNGNDKEEAFFAKYLTNQKLFQLQIADSQFRRYFLVQCLILTQYLTSDVKFRDSTYFLTKSQQEYIDSVTDRCYRLLAETYPHGRHFSESIRKTLQREKLWSNWKNDGCPDVLKDLKGQKMQMFKKKQAVNYDPAKIDLGNAELTRLWNVNPDIRAACKDEKRKFLSNVEDFVSDALDELDPEQMVDEEYKCINQEVWQWRASRLLMFETDQYLTTCCYGAPKAGGNATNSATFLTEVLKNTCINGSNELKAKGDAVFKRIETKKQQDEERRLAEEKRRQEEEAAEKTVAEKASEKSSEKPEKPEKLEKPSEVRKRPSMIEVEARKKEKEEPKNESHDARPTPVTPVPPSPKKIKLEEKKEVDKKEKDKEKTDGEPKKRRAIESVSEAPSSKVAVKEEKEMKKSRSDSKDAASSSKDSSSSTKSNVTLYPISEKEVQQLAPLIPDPHKLSQALGIPAMKNLDDYIKARGKEKAVYALLSNWAKQDKSKDSLHKLYMKLSEEDLLDEKLSSLIKEMSKNRVSEREKDSQDKEKEKEKDKDKDKDKEKAHSTSSSSRKHDK